MAEETKPIFRPLSADDPEPEVTEMESLCMNCHENGTTRLLLTKIPFYKEVVLSSFECHSCGHRNSETLSGGRIEDTGVRYTLAVRTAADLNRRVCKSDHSTVRIPELDLDIPSQAGGITSVEGILDRSVEGLEQDQDCRREQDPDTADKIAAFVERLRALKVEGTPFTLILEDISGNAFVSSPNAPLKDDQLVVSHFVRSEAQDHALGIFEEPATIKPISAEEFSYENLIQEVIQFAANCSQCSAPCETNMKLTKIPHFKEVVIMSTNCDTCGNRSNEIKSGGGIEPQGLRIVIAVTKPEDLTRDILKAETCALEIPELELEVGPRALGGRFTTVEGLLQAMRDQISESSAMFADSQEPDSKERLESFMAQLESCLAVSRPFSLVLDDPAGNSYVQSLTHPSPDPALKVTRYDRTTEQNDDLGLTDMRTEDYEEDN